MTDSSGDTDRVFCGSPDEAMHENNVRTGDGTDRTLYTYFEGQNMAAGFEWVEPGCEVPWHSHPTSEEVIYCTHGEGMAFVGEQKREMVPGTMVFLPMGVKHRFANTSSSARLGFTWTLSPPQKARNFMPGVPPQ
eukprot:Sspe_Gene.43158::Locus_20998_Transcript_1_1_Confidence_1.000_Length_4608::g.43158::m.43158